MGKMVVKAAKNGLFFNLKADNGEVIATSQVYQSEKGLRNGMVSVMVNAILAQEQDQTVAGFKTMYNPKFEIYTDKAGEFRFRLKAKNGKLIASSEGYKKKESCMNGIRSVRENAPAAEIVWDIDY